MRSNDQLFTFNLGYASPALKCLTSSDIEKLSGLNVPVPVNEAERIFALRQSELLDSDTHDPMFDRFTSLAQRLFKCPIALVSLVDIDRQWFKSKVGLDANETHRNLAFCAYTVLPETPDVFVVEDALLDARFKDSALVQGEPHIRFYAGAALMVGDVKVGSLCVIDRVPHIGFSTEERMNLLDLGVAVSRLIEERRDAAAGLQKELSQMMGDMLHNLRTPLFSLSWATHMLMEDFANRRQLIESRLKNGDSYASIGSNSTDLMDIPTIDTTITLTGNDAHAEAMRRRKSGSSTGSLHNLLELYQSSRKSSLRNPAGALPNVTDQEFIEALVAAETHSAMIAKEIQAAVGQLKVTVDSGTTLAELAAEKAEWKHKLSSSNKTAGAYPGVQLCNLPMTLRDAQKTLSHLDNIEDVQWIKDPTFESFSATPAAPLSARPGYMASYVNEPHQICVNKAFYFIILDCIPHLLPHFNNVKVTLSFVQRPENWKRLESFSGDEEMKTKTTSSGTNDTDAGRTQGHVTDGPFGGEFQFESILSYIDLLARQGTRGLDNTTPGLQLYPGAENVSAAGSAVEDPAPSPSSLQYQQGEWAQGVVEVKFQATGKRPAAELMMQGEEKMADSFASEKNGKFYSLEQLLADYEGGMRDEKSEDGESHTISCWLPCGVFGPPTSYQLSMDDECEMTVVGPQMSTVTSMSLDDNVPRSTSDLSLQNSVNHDHSSHSQDTASSNGQSPPVAESAATTTEETKAQNANQDGSGRTSTDTSNKTHSVRESSHVKVTSFSEKSTGDLTSTSATARAPVGLRGILEQRKHSARRHRARSSVVKLRVLLVEDSQSLQKVISRWLRSQGCEVTIANNGQEGLLMLQYQQFDVLFMDFLMPVMSGSEAFKAFHEWRKSDTVDNSSLSTTRLLTADGDSGGDTSSGTPASASSAGYGLAVDTELILQSLSQEVSSMSSGNVNDNDQVIHGSGRVRDRDGDGDGDSGGEFITKRSKSEQLNLRLSRASNSSQPVQDARRLNDNLLMVGMSANAIDDDIVSAFEHGMHFFCPKPPENKMLQKILDIAKEEILKVKICNSNTGKSSFNCIDNIVDSVCVKAGIDCKSPTPKREVHNSPPETASASELTTTSKRSSIGHIRSKIGSAAIADDPHSRLCSGSTDGWHIFSWTSG